MDKYFIFASNCRAYVELINVVKELKEKGEKYFFLYTTNTISSSPVKSIDNFNYDTNIESSTNKIFVQNLGFDLPFTPDIILLTRESWSPEKELIYEFKTIGSIVCCLENSNSWFYNNIKTRLEILSRMKFPTNIIDKHFEHCHWSLDTKKLAGWVNFKSDIVGVPRFDKIFDDINTDFVINKYNLNIEKKSVLIFGSMEHDMRPNILSEVNYLKNNLSNDFEILYRPHPSEFEKFSNDFYPNFYIDGIKVIDNDLDVKSIAYLSDFHISMFQGVTHYSLAFNKKLIIPKNNFGVKNEMNMDLFKEKEFSFWANIFNINCWEQFKEFVNLDLIEEFIIRYDDWWDDICNSLSIYDRDLSWSLNTEPSKHNNRLLKYFDEFNDQKASIRLINKMKKMKGK